MLKRQIEEQNARCLKPQQEENSNSNLSFWERLQSKQLIIEFINLLIMTIHIIVLFTLSFPVLNLIFVSVIVGNCVLLIFVEKSKTVDSSLKTKLFLLILWAINFILRLVDVIQM